MSVKRIGKFVMSEIWSAAIILLLGFIGFLFYGPPKSSDLHDTNSGEKVHLNKLEKINFQLLGACHVTLVRQSGNIYRDLGKFCDVNEGIREVIKSLRRAKVDEVRITHDDQKSLAIYRTFYDFTGRAEGKKLAGAIFEAVAAERQVQMASLKSSLREAVHKGGTSWEVFFNYQCGQCNGTSIEVEDEANEDSTVSCNTCGYIFGSYAELQVFVEQKAEAEVSRLNQDQGQ